MTHAHGRLCLGDMDRASQGMCPEMPLREAPQHVYMTPPSRLLAPVYDAFQTKSLADAPLCFPVRVCVGVLYGCPATSPALFLCAGILTGEQDALRIRACS